MKQLGREHHNTVMFIISHFITQGLKTHPIVKQQKDDLMNVQVNIRQEYHNWLGQFSSVSLSYITNWNLK